jgi:sugar (pentulose or hexulose) kinase
MPIHPAVVYLSGGRANSPAWRQIVADCLGQPVSVPEGSQFGAKGAAINVGEAVGIYRDAPDAVANSVRVASVCRPDAANTRLYQELYQVYRKTAERQMDLWDMRARIISGGKPA